MADITLMRQLDELYLKWAFYGSRGLCVKLQHLGYWVNRQHPTVDAPDGTPDDVLETANE